MPDKFRVYKFINEINTLQRDKTQLNIAIIIAELIHYLADAHQVRTQGKSPLEYETLYMNRIESVKTYIKKHLKKRIHARSRYFLQCLIAVESGDGRRVRVEKHAAKYWKKLQQTDKLVSLEMVEIIPFEVLWGEVLRLLH